MADASNTGATAPPSPAPSPPPRRKRPWRTAATVAALAVVLTLGLAAAHRPLLVGLAYLLRVDDPAPSDAIVLLLGGETHRPRKAAELYKRGIAPVILLCRDRVNPLLPYDQSDMIKQYLIRQGVPDDAVVIVPGERVSSTRDEVQRIADYLQHHPARRITVVTTSFHSARARWIFRRGLTERGVDVRMASTTHPRFDESNWYRREDGLVYYLQELVKTVYYRLRY